MTTAFALASDVEKRALMVLIPFAKGKGIRIVLTDDQPILQKTIGDMIVQHLGHSPYTAELKAEETNKHGNLYLESWSNKPLLTPGWMHTTRADRLWYFFLEQRLLYSCNMSDLREWAFVKRRAKDFPEKRQEKREQLNETWGFCVPISILELEIMSFNHIEIDDGL